MKDILMNLFFFVVCIYVVMRNKMVFKKLTIPQLLGVVFSYMGVICIGFICIYYGGNWISGYLKTNIIRTVVELLVIVTSLTVCQMILKKLLLKITKGAVYM
ncbi:MAG: hypothetical protein ABGX20_14540 [Bacillus sp. (in: firmicutes)]